MDSLSLKYDKDDVAVINLNRRGIPDGNEKGV
jgi:hypothetical protein